jgi:high-affinity Fe2+/Pb2+ permease
MATDLVPLKHSASDHLHPMIYRAMAALAAWFVLSAWLLFGGGDEYFELSLGIVSVFLLIVVAIPFVLWLSWWKFEGARAGPRRERFREWIAGDFDTGHGRMPARDAVIEILLPLMAVAFGITLFGIVLYFDLAKLPPV